MPESFKYNRIKFFRKGIQRHFILKAKKSLVMNGREFAEKLGISQRTLTDWTHEKITLSLVFAQKISKLTKISIPKNHTIIDWRLHFKKVGKMGGKNRLALYGRVALDENNRKQKWQEWWRNIGQYKKPAPGFQTLKKINMPRKNKLLAEFIGILLGDGNISPYHIGITLSSKEIKFKKYVQKIIKKLFGVSSKIIRHKAKAITIVVNRKLLVDFCQKVGFEMGNKITHQVDIPDWIKENKMFSLECIRGLVDTDGCFFLHSYVVNGKKYFYLKIAFTSASRPLIASVRKILINFGFNVRISKNGKDVRIDDQRYVFKYIREVGTHNQKHLDKINKWKVALNGKAAVC